MSGSEQKIFIISGPSRVGKDAISRELLQKDDLRLQRVVTATSRPQRSGEIEGVDYYYFSLEEFQEKITEGYFLEWAVLAGGTYYGTPLSEFDRIKALGKNVLLKIDVQGAARLAQMRDDIVRIFIKPDSVENLKRRMGEAHFSSEQVTARLSDLERELHEATKYDYIVVNEEGKLMEAVENVSVIIRKEIQK